MQISTHFHANKPDKMPAEVVTVKRWNFIPLLLVAIDTDDNY